MKKILNIIKIVLLALLAIILLCVLIVSMLRFSNKLKAEITSKYGVDESIYIDLNGVEQYVNIRGQDTSNPVIIFLHGGPGFPIGYLSYVHQQPVEEKYTVINWDQRGCGRTYYKSGDAELTVECLLDDVDALVEYAKDRFQKDKVIIIGQSWGSVLGSTYAANHPENVLAYVGVGQVIDFIDGKIFAAETAMQYADETDRQTLKTAVEEFEKVDSVDDIDIQNLIDLIVTSLKYLKGSNENGGLAQAFMGLTSYNMNSEDIKWYFNAADTEKIFELEHDLINYMYFEFDIYDMATDYDVPILFLQGSNDYITPTGMAEEYFKQIDAQNKLFAVVNGAGHTPFLDCPEEYAGLLMEFLDGIEE